MTTKIRMWVAGIMLAAVAGMFYLAGETHAGGDPELKAAIAKVGNAIKAGKDADAKAMVAAAVEKLDDIEPIMYMFKPRKKDGKGGIGWGSTPPLNPADDGIEVMVRKFSSKAVPPNFDKKAAEEAGYWVAAIAEMAKAKGLDKYQGKRTKKEWERFNDEMRDAGIALAKAAAGGKPAEVKSAAYKLNDICSACHTVFKD